MTTAPNKVRKKRRQTISPTQRALKFYRDLGFTAQVVERWNAFAHIRQDLFGFIDIVCIMPGVGIIGVQATSGPNHAARQGEAMDHATGRNYRGPHDGRTTMTTEITLRSPRNNDEYLRLFPIDDGSGEVLLKIGHAVEPGAMIVINPADLLAAARMMVEVTQEARR